MVAAAAHEGKQGLLLLPLQTWTSMIPSKQQSFHPLFAYA